MTYNRWPSFKTGYNVCRSTFIDPANLTPTQKMELARNRIWGNYVGGNYRSGFRQMKKLWAGRSKSQYYEFADLKMVYPWVNDYESRDIKKIKYMQRRHRIFMRGIKIGAAQVKDQNKAMAVFQQGVGLRQ